MAGAMATKDPSSWDSLYVCLIFSIALIIIRLGLRLFRRQSFTRGDYWCMTAAVFILARLVANHFLLVYGSTRSMSAFSDNNERCQVNEILALTSQQRIDLLNGPEEELARKVMGSKLALGTRTLLVCM
jgi:hypothetical protein